MLLTLDKDFGELAFRQRHTVPAVILFRLLMSSPVELAEAMVSTIASRLDWDGHFSTIDERRIRMRPLPPS